MKLSQLEMFVEAANNGSITEAARRLNKSRSTVSTAISALEDSLGVSLFERGSNLTELTVIGEQILDDSERILQIAYIIEQKCQHYASGAEAVLRIARDDALSEVFWRRLLGDLKHTFSGTSVSLVLASPPELPQLVEDGIVDAAFGLLTEEQESTSLKIEVLHPLRTMMVVEKQHPLALLKRVQHSDLESHTQITLSYADHESVKTLLPVSGDHIGLSCFEMMRDAVMDKLGWAILPIPLIKTQLRQDQLRVLKHKFSMQWRDYAAYASPAAYHGKVLSWIQQEIQKELESYD
ncbi:LysR family transcriptional regulator [Plesiomonas shigelloides]|uniref:LysR family transcriptional regulator n=1 Tax=Plesiomonas shigelloides TaxID=703 RepID=UPI000D133F29|nr:LysR family transcriptional regulator [Plesiomonas shigelloides]AVQ88085.1 LysR family transcriptional regulator [Plesiomonas shigelloides]MBW3792242.1 LysR family transcriptional regulator [Plesiomonas shigelloides]